MNDSDVRALVLEYLSGHFTAERERVLQSQLTEHGYAIDELDDLRETYARLDDIPVPAASEAMTENFYRMLEEHKPKAKAQPSRFVSLMASLRDRCDHRFIARVACGLVLLGVGWSLGFWSAPNGRYEQRLDDVTTEIREVKGMVVYAMLNQSSPSERIRTIHQIKTCGFVDEGMIAVLLNMLGHDPNVNVRLVALETLAVQTDRATVRQGLVHSLSQQESPLVQMALADVLVSLGRKTAMSQFRELLERPDLNDIVRARITSGLERLM
jgi:HEAT repeats